MDSVTFNRDFIAKVFTDSYVGLVGYYRLIEMLGDRASKVFKRLESSRAQISRFKSFHGQTYVFYRR